MESVEDPASGSDGETMKIRSQNTESRIQKKNLIAEVLYVPSGYWILATGFWQSTLWR